MWENCDVFHMKLICNSENGFNSYLNIRKKITVWIVTHLQLKYLCAQFCTPSNNVNKTGLSECTSSKNYKGGGGFYSTLLPKEVMFPINAERCRQPDLEIQHFLSLWWMRITPPNLNWQWIFSSIQDKWLFEFWLND